MNTHRLTPLQALTIADKGGREHRDTDRLALPRSYPYRRIPTQEGHRQEDRNTQGRHPRPCCSLLLALALSLYDDEHRKGNERSQGHRNTDRLTPLQALAIADTGGQEHRRATGSLSLGLILTGEYRHRRTGHRRIPPYHWRPLTQATGSPLLALAPSVYDDAPQRK